MDYIHTLFSLEGRTALVTGSGKGLGAVLAFGLARAGARVVLNARSEPSIRQSAEALRSQGFTADYCRFDVTDSAEVDAGIDWIEREIGPIDILVNNAGIQRRAALEVFPEADFKELLDTNVTGAFLVSKRVVRGMMQRESGRIVNICSLQSEVGRPGIAPYAASKGGLKMLTKGMAIDWAKYGIQVNAIGPGYFKTELTQALVQNHEFDAWITGRTPLRRWGEPEELIAPLLFLVSPGASFITGQILYVDGGVLATL